MAAFGYNIAPGTSAESLALRRRIAEQMMMEGSGGKPVRHWLQGANKIAQGLIGGYHASRADRADAARTKQTQEMLSGLFGLGDESADISPASYAPTDIRPPIAKGDMGIYGDAISGIESGGDYGKLGPVTAKGDRAYGKYQVMGSNVGPWTKEVLGQEMSAEDFLASPEAQDAVFNAKFGEYADKYGPEGAARAWFAGEGGMNDMGRRDQLGTTVEAYARKFNRGVRRSGAAPKAETPRIASKEKRRLRQAIAMISNPDTAELGNKILLDYLTRTGSDTSGIREYQLAQQQGYQGSFLDFQRELKGTSTKPTSAMQEYELAKSQGFTGSFLDYQRTAAGGEAGAKEEAKTQIEARNALPAAQTNVQASIDTINRLRNHPGNVWGTGATGKIARNLWGTDEYDFDALNKRASGQTFLAAREALKGAGQVTDFEGQKGEQAIANLDAAQSRKAYMEALDDLERMMKASLADLQKKAGVSGGAPQVGQIEDGYRFKGGNPADPNSWERVQ